jgi:glycosyltransferase involved in cell wall biosynthesis
MKPSLTKVCVISNFYEENTASRTHVTYKYFLQEKYNVFLLYSTYSHSLKKFRYFNGDDYVPVKTIRYKSNFTPIRFISHIVFQIKVCYKLVYINPAIVYVTVPTNGLSFFLSLMKQILGYKLIIDIVDLWPETFPINPKIKPFLIASIGLPTSMARRISIKLADYTLTSSNYFKSVLKLNNKSSGVIYLKKILLKERNPLISNLDNVLTIGYIGNIGAIYDFQGLLHLLKEVKKIRPVHLKILGEGNLTKWLLAELDKLGVKYQFFGATYDEDIKERLLEDCWFGFNGFKSNTEVALSYKSLEYLSFSVPIINSAKGDTWEFIDKNNIGLNYDTNDLDMLIEKISKISKDELIEMKDSSFKFFQSKFSYSSFVDEMNIVLKAISVK